MQVSIHRRLSTESFWVGTGIVGSSRRACRLLLGESSAYSTDVGKNIKEIDFKKWKKEHPGKDPSSLNSDWTMYINKLEYHNKYTKGDAGQVKYGGWSKDGLEKFNTLKQLAKAGQKHANCQPLEEKILEKICKIHEITASNYLDHLNATCRHQHRRVDPLQGRVKTISDFGGGGWDDAA